MSHLGPYKPLLFESHVLRLTRTYICLAILLSGCTKAYDPPVHGIQNILVVDGTITNVAENYNVSLSYAKPYNSSVYRPVTRAEVFIKDDQGKTFNMYENPNGSGNYFTVPTEFIGIIGRTYTLHITTSDGSTYQSAKQQMLQPIPFDSIYGTVFDQQYLQNSGTVNIPGVNTYINIQKSQGSATNFRFTDSLLIERSVQVPSSFIQYADNLYFEWYEVGLDHTVNIPGPNSNTNPSNITKFLINYFPLDQDVYAFPATPYPFYAAPGSPPLMLNVVHWILYVNVYAINYDTYQFYNQINEQLNPGNTLFDPIAWQIQGNMTCTSDSSQSVLGKFEASAYIKRTYVVEIHGNDSITYNQIPNLEIIPYSGIPNATQPPFWIN